VIRTDCKSNACRKGPDGNSVCTEPCTLDPDSCAAGFACSAEGYCYKGTKVGEPPVDAPPVDAPPVGATPTAAESSGCNTSGTGNASGFALLTLCFALMRRRR
jgi:MYXO-CTERM domain-containing protein